MTKNTPRIFVSLLLMLLCIGILPVSAFASGGEESTESVAEQETAGDVSDLLSALAGSQVTVSVTEDGIQFSSGENDSGQTGTVTTGGGNLNVRTGTGLDRDRWKGLFLCGRCQSGRLG